MALFLPLGTLAEDICSQSQFQGSLIRVITILHWEFYQSHTSYDFGFSYGSNISTITVFISNWNSFENRKIQFRICYKKHICIVCENYRKITNTALCLLDLIDFANHTSGRKHVIDLIPNVWVSFFFLVMCSTPFVSSCIPMVIFSQDVFLHGYTCFENPAADANILLWLFRRLNGINIKRRFIFKWYQKQNSAADFRIF